MKETYKGHKIEYMEYNNDWKIELEGNTYCFYTVGQARKAIDDYEEARKMVGIEVIGWSSLNGKMIVTRISRINLKEDKMRSGNFAFDFMDKNNERLHTLGPFIEATQDNILLANKYQTIRSKEEELRNQREGIWEILMKKRIDTPPKW